MERSFAKITLDYWMNINSLKSYAETLKPLAIDKDKIKYESFLTNLLKDMGMSENDIEEFGKEKIAQFTEIAVTSQGQDDFLEKFINLTQDSFNIQELNMEKLLDLMNTEEKYKMLRLLNRGMYSMESSKADLLYRSALITLISYFEVFIAEILHLYYNIKPQALSGDDKILSYNELVKFDTIEEAIDRIASEKIEGFLRGSLEDWKNFFQKQLKINLSELISNWEDFVEIYQRRHLLVHNDRRINNQYLNKVEKKWFDKQEKSYNVGDILEITDDYLFNAIKLFLVVGIKLIDLCWDKLLPDEKDMRDTNLVSLIYELLFRKEWETAEMFCCHALNRDCYSPSIKQIYIMNRWLCLKRMSKWNIIKNEVDKFDHNASNPTYSLCVYSLVEDKNNFYKTLPIAVQCGLKRQDLVEWPVFYEMRQTEEFKQMIDSLFK